MLNKFLETLFSNGNLYSLIALAWAANTSGTLSSALLYGGLATLSWTWFCFVMDAIGYGVKGNKS